MKYKKSFILFIIFLFSQHLWSQISLLYHRNTPKAEYGYIYKKFSMNYQNAIHAGSDTVWDFSDAFFLNDTIMSYFTTNPNYISFPGYDYNPNFSQPPDPSDTTFLRSDNAIFKLSDTNFIQAYKVIYPPIMTGIPPYIGEVQIPVLVFPFQLNSYLDLGSYSGSGAPGSSSCTTWKQADSYGSIITPDSVYSNLLRVHTYYEFSSQDASHAGHGSTINTYEWYSEYAELPLFKIRFSDNWSYDMGPISHFYDTAAFFFMQKLNIPYSVISHKSVSESDINIFPNPAKDRLNISSSFDIENICIFNLFGQQLAEVNGFGNPHQKIIDIRNICEGLYLVKVSLKNKSVFFKKIIIVKTEPLTR